MRRTSPKVLSPTTSQKTERAALMHPRMHGFILGLAVVLLGLSAALAAETSVRAAPVRPGAKSPAQQTKKVSHPSTLTLADVAKKLGLGIHWSEPRVKATLSDATRRLELGSGSREVQINGLRVFLGEPVALNRGELHVSAIDYHTCLVPLLRPSLAPGRPARPKVIAIDAGHGGVDQGTENRRLQYKEKVFTLDVAIRLKKLLEQQNYTVVLTRTKDVTIDKPMRVLVANRAGADVFVSIHFNSLANDRVTSGTEVFTFAPQHQRSTNSWGLFEADDTESEVAPGNDFDAWNALLAHSIHRELLGGLKTLDRGKKIGHLGVLRGLKCPGVLVESGFLSNDEEAARIATPAYRQEIAVALAAGINGYANQVDALRAKR